MNKDTILSSIEFLNNTISDLEVEIDKLVKVGSEGSFVDDKDYDKYTYLSAKLSNLKFFSNEVLYNCFLGDENKIITEDYSDNYETYMRGMYDSLKIFIDSLNC